MKYLASPFTSSMTLAVAVALSALLALTSARPVHAATGSPARQTAGKTSAVDRAEARIKELHEKLRITPAQEDQWKNVADVMRDNAQRLDDLVRTRTDQAQTMTAVQDVQTYGEI